MQPKDRIGTQLKESENFKRREARFEEIVESVNDMIYELDQEGKFAYANEALERFSRYNKKELQKIRYWELVKVDYREALITFYQDQIKNLTEDTYYEFPMVNKKGEEVWVGQSVKMVFADKKIKTVRAVARDITSLKQAQQKLEKREEETQRALKKLKKAKEKLREYSNALESKSGLLESILDTMADGVMVADIHGKFLVFNPALQMQSQRLKSL
jgi:PAS domain S-box-containing protein